MKKKILFVEDDADLGKIMASVLTEEGYEVSQASSGEAALEFCRSNTPDLIISDVSMAEMDGFTFLEQIRRKKRLKVTPFMFVTAFEGGVGLKKAKELGAVAYITKPFDLDNVLGTVKTLLK